MNFVVFATFILTKAFDPWIHSVHLYGSQNKSPLYMQESLFDQVRRTIVLQDGRKVTCGIPLDPTFSISEEILWDHQTSNRKPTATVFEEITSSQALQILYPLKDQCAYHHTEEFLWQFCFKKYVRQYDNEYTVKNMQKNQYEEFFIGYSNNYNRANNQTVGIYMPQWANMKVQLLEVSQQHLLNIDAINKRITSKLNSTQQMTDEDVDNQIYRFEIPRSSEQVQLYGFQFKIGSLNKQKVYQLKLKIGFDTKKYKDMELMLFSDPTPAVYVREYGTRGNFTTMDPRFANQTLIDRHYWIVVDEEYLTVGIGHYISLSHVLLRKRLIRTHDELTPTLMYVDVESDTMGLKLIKLFPMNLSDYQPRRLPWSNVGPVFNPLNFSGYTVLESSYQMSQVKYQYTETYGSGSYCGGAVQKPRSIDIRMVCSQNSFLEILSVTEPRICQYKMEVGTSLLCDPEEFTLNTKSKSTNGQRMVCSLVD